MTRFAWLGTVVAALVAGCGDGGSSGGDLPIGAACSVGTDCAQGTCAGPSVDFPDGLCTMACLDGLCPAGSICLALGDPPLCFAACTSSDGCRSGYGCAAGGGCVPCALDPSACPAATDADADGDDATPDAPDADADGDEGPDADADADAEAEAEATDLANGSPCTDATQCHSRVCLPPELGGLCAARCAPDDACDYGYSCVPYGRDTDANGLTDTVVFGCYDWETSAKQDGMVCAGDADCRSRLCMDGICTQLCDLASDCTALSRCGERTLPLGERGPGSYPACVFDPVTTSEIRTVDLGTETLTTGDAGRSSALWLPPGAVSMQIVARQSGTQGAYIGMIDVWDSTADHIFNYVDFVEGRDTPNWHMPDSRLGSFLVPISNRVTFRAGRYLYTPAFLAPDASTTVTDVIQYSAFVKLDPGGAVAGNLSVNLYFVGSDQVDAASAPGSSRLQGALDEWESIYRAAGITVGGYNYRDITGADETRYRVVEYSDTIDNGEVGPLMALSAGRTEWAVNVFLVHDFTGYGLLGIAGGIPGPPAIHGTTHSSVLVCVDCAWPYGGQFLGQVIAHEVGHYLGLFHSTEDDSRGWPYSGDALADTTTGDDNNLMYWQAAGGSNLSNGQGWVMRRAPLVAP